MSDKITFRNTHHGYLVNRNGRQAGVVTKRGTVWFVTDVFGKGMVYAIQTFGKQHFANRAAAAQALVAHVGI
jgi:hypothetical protein